MAQGGGGLDQVRPEEKKKKKKDGQRSPAAPGLALLLLLDRFLFENPKHRHRLDFFVSLRFHLSIFFFFFQLRRVVAAGGLTPSFVFSSLALARD